MWIAVVRAVQTQTNREKETKRVQDSKKKTDTENNQTEQNQQTDYIDINIRAHTFVL